DQIVTSIKRDALGRPTQVVYGNNAISRHTYNSSTLRLDELQTVQGATCLTQPTTCTLLQDYLYGYDSNGNITGLTDGVDGAMTATYGYDTLDRLTSMVSTGSGINYTYGYDVTGNLTSKQGVTQTYGGAGRGPHAL